MKLFAQIRKVDEEKRLVYGRAADETVDKSNEALNYNDSKPHFVKWSEDISKDTDGKSLGNVRAMHGKVAAGKLTAIDFDDNAKTIDVCAKVVDDAEWKKVMEGVYTGFSIGGSYGAKSVEKIADRDVTRYVAIPSEISLVDRPCIPTAKFFQVQKADGSTADVEFQQHEEEQVEKVADATVEGTPEQVDELTQVMVEKGLSLTQVIAMAKGFVPFEAKDDADDSDEAKAKKAKDAKDAEEKDAACKAEAAAALLKAEQDAAELAKVAPVADMQKMIAEAVAPLQKVIDEANAKIAKLEAQPAAPRVSLRAVSKAADTGEDSINQPTEKDLVKDSAGEIHAAASLIKQAFASGGQPLHSFNQIR